MTGKGRKGTDEQPGVPRCHAKPGWASWTESYLFAGTSGLMLLIVILFPQYWYLSFVALCPLFYRMLGAAPREAWRLGFLFGLTFLLMSTLGRESFFLLPAVSKVLIGTTLFTVFGWSVGFARQRWGFNPIIIALLWLVVEPWLVKLGFSSGVFSQAHASHPLLNGVGGLFGFLIISLIIILVNSLLAGLIKKAVLLAEDKQKPVAEKELLWVRFAHSVFTTGRAYLVPDARGPPGRRLFYAR